MINKFSGRITFMSPTETKTSKAGKEYTKSELVVTELAEAYPNSIVISCFGERCNEAAKHAIGDNVTVLYNIKAELYNGRYYNSVTFFKYDEPAQSEQTPATAPTPTPEPQPAKQGQLNLEPTQDDDLPF